MAKNISLGKMRKSAGIYSKYVKNLLEFDDGFSALSQLFKLPICKPNIYIKEKAYYTVAGGKDISTYTNEQGEMETERRRP